MEVKKSVSISEQIDVDYRKYALYVIQSRGIPNFYDCLTPVQRLILQNSPTGFKKTVGVIGEVFSTGLYHHGDFVRYNTKINLADGTQITIGEWSKKYPEARLLVYSVDEDGNKVIGEGHSPRVGHITDEMIRIEMENEEIFECTGNHPFLTKNRGWVNAKDLLDTDEIVNL